MKKRLALLLAVAAVLAAGALLYLQKSKADEVHRAQFFAMDTVMTLTAYGPHGEEAVSAAREEINRLDALWSTGRADSEVARLNAERTLALSEETRALLEQALWFSGDTGGCFDPTVYPLMELWGFPSRDYHVPSREELDRILPLVGADRIVLTGNTAVLDEGQAIDLGGIAKGWISARIMEIFSEKGVQSGIVSLGGNVQTLGKKPDGSLWKIGIRDPLAEDQGSYFGVLSSSGKAVITSGGYERFFVEDGQTYVHILDPKTGAPARSDLLSVTMVSSDSTAADALSTALYVMGSKRAAGYWRERVDRFDLILVRKDGAILVTEGIADNFETDRTVTVLHRSESPA